MMSDRLRIRRGLRRLGREAVTLALPALGAGWHNTHASHATCFLAHAILGGPAPEIFDDWDAIADYSRDQEHAIAVDEDMRQLSLAHSGNRPLLEQEVERFLGFSVAEGRRSIFGLAP